MSIHDRNTKSLIFPPVNIHARKTISDILTPVDTYDQTLVFSVCLPRRDNMIRSHTHTHCLTLTGVCVPFVCEPSFVIKRESGKCVSCRFHGARQSGSNEPHLSTLHCYYHSHNLCYCYFNLCHTVVVNWMYVVSVMANC